MPDPIPGEWLSAATLAIEAQPSGTPAARLAMAALEAAAPLMRAEAEGAETEWALSYTYRPRLSGLPVRRVVQPYPDEAMAREAVAAVRDGAPEDEPRLMRREIGPWKDVPGA